MRCDLIALRDWLQDAGCTLVAMESTGVYWKPVHAMLEEHFDVVVANARHIKNVPGRKTDVKDCEWISDLARHGLISRGFVPPQDIRALRELNRFRRKAAQLQTGERNRLIKVLEAAGIKLAGVASDALGVSGRAIIRALIGGEDTSEAMAGLARGTLRTKMQALARALDAPLMAHQRLMLQTQLDRIERPRPILNASTPNCDRWRPHIRRLANMGFDVQLKQKPHDHVDTISGQATPKAIYMTARSRVVRSARFRATAAGGPPLSYAGGPA
jgi:hypothetical protein